MRDTINAEILRLRKVIKPLSAIFLSGLLFVSLLLASCKKTDTTDIGVGLLGNQLHGMYTELNLITHTKVFDSIKTSLPTVLMCGNLYDPKMGTTSASFYSEVWPLTGNISFGHAPVMDSVVLSLTYKGYYGRPAPLRFKVYQVLEEINFDSVFYSFSHKRIDPSPLADVTLEPNSIDSVHADSTTYPPQLRIKLDMNRFSTFLDSSLYLTLPGFLSHFHGINVCAFQTPLSGDRAIYSFNANDPRSKITMYYRNSTSATRELHFDFDMGGLSGRFNHFDHDYTTAPGIENQLTGAYSNDTVNEDFVYVQGLAGLQTKIYLPSLSPLQQNGPVAINQGELEVKLDPSTVDGYFLPPAQMVIVALDENEHPLITPDLLEGTAYSGGVYDAINKKYTFNIGRYMQQVMTGKIIDRGLMMIPVTETIYPNRGVLGGGKSTSPYKMRLKVTYTKL